MIWIELLGPSGVGKSYWYEKFMQKYPEYEPRQLVLNRIYTSSEFNRQSLKIKLMFYIYKMNIYKISNHLKHELYNDLVEKFDRKSRTIYNQNDEMIIKKYLENKDILNEPQIVILSKIKYFYDKIRELKFLEFYLLENDIYIAEDGLMHLSPIFISELQAEKIIIFEKSYKIVVNQRMKRAKERPTTFIEFLLKDEVLKKYIEDYYNIYKKKITSINHSIHPSKVKTIDLEKKDVLKKIHEWITEPKSNQSIKA